MQRTSSLSKRVNNKALSSSSSSAPRTLLSPSAPAQRSEIGVQRPSRAFRNNIDSAGLKRAGNVATCAKPRGWWWRWWFRVAFGVCCASRAGCLLQYIPRHGRRNVPACDFHVDCSYREEFQTGRHDCQTSPSQAATCKSRPCNLST